MVRWRGCVIFMIILLLVPFAIQSERDESTEEGEVEEDLNNTNEEEDGAEDRDDEEARPQSSPPPSKVTTTVPVSRTTTIPPLECYTCAFKNDMPLSACLDPTFNRVHVATCDNVDDKCFTMVLNRVNNDFETLIRGCKSHCENTSDNKCCETPRCNNETFSRAVVQPKSAIKLHEKSSSKSLLAPNIVLFVTTLLILQTIAKAAFSENL